MVGQVKLECIFTLRSQPITHKSYRWQIKEADYLETAENPVSESNSDGTWIEPTLHNSDGTWPSSTYVNYSPSSTYNYTYGYYDDTNVNNVARLSYQLRIQTINSKYATDNTFPDMRVVGLGQKIVERVLIQSTTLTVTFLTYTELFQKDSSTTQTFRHFFLIRDDGFVVWEHDPNSRSDLFIKTPNMKFTIPNRRKI